MSRFKRFAQLGRIGTSLTGHGIRQRVFGKTDKLAAARDLTHTLGKMKGAAMKIGQQLALMADVMDLPDDVRKTLSKLNREAQPVPWTDIKAVLTDEIGSLDAYFSEVDEQPLGTASLAQAHAATLKEGERVVVKVLHPGVLESLETDLLALRALLKGGRLVGRSDEECDGIYQEVDARLREELDYLNEAANLATFSELFEGDNRVAIPSPYVEFCTERVLVLDRIEGLPLDQFVTQATPEARQRAGSTLAAMFFEQAFIHRTLHADPHPGNYLFQPDGTVGLIDFGCVKRFDEFFLGAYARTARAALRQERAKTLSYAKDLGVWTGNTPQAGEAIWMFCESALAPWREGDMVLGGGDNLIQRTQAASEQLWKYPEVMGVPDMVYLHRTLAGMYTMARRLEVTQPWGTILDAYLTYAIDVADGNQPTVPHFDGFSAETGA